ncbi:MAG: hypothetical protein D6725_04910 [Planctomycetota bacterium]|nr:MAG: hypothetical protein D6725_04910 [Planctomycetota bacterium]
MCHCIRPNRVPVRASARGTWSRRFATVPAGGLLRPHRRRGAGAGQCGVLFPRDKQENPMRAAECAAKRNGDATGPMACTSLPTGGDRRGPPGRKAAHFTRSAVDGKRETSAGRGGDRGAADSRADTGPPAETARFGQRPRRLPCW